MWIRAPRIVRVNEFVTETRPSGNILFIHNYDRAGVVGNIGLTMGKHDINITSMHIAGNPKGDRAMALVKIDRPVSEEILEELKALPNLIEIKQIRL